MLKTYQATLHQGQIQWLDDRPDIKNARIIVTIMEEFEPHPGRHPPRSIAGKAKTMGDIVSPILDEGDWECLT